MKIRLTSELQALWVGLFLRPLVQKLQRRIEPWFALQETVDLLTICLNSKPPKEWVFR